MNCNSCKWSNPETCRICKAEQWEKQSGILFRGKAKEMTRNELAKAWYFGRLKEPLEVVDFSVN